MQRFGSTYLPTEDFDQVHWLKPLRPPDSPIWYYWLQRTKEHTGEFVDPATVDVAIRPIIEFFHRRQIRTLPSCEGHFYVYDDVKDHVQTLQEEQDLLRRGLLTLTDVETGMMLSPTIRDYRAPNARSLAEELFRNQGRGTIGCVMGDVEEARRLRHGLRSRGISGVRLAGDGCVVKINVWCVAPDDLDGIWQEVFHGIRRTM